MKNLQRRLALLLTVALVFGGIPSAASAGAATTATPAAIAPAAIPVVDYASVSFVDANIGFAAGASGTIIKTTDGGETWTKLNTETTSADFRGIVFWSATTCLLYTS